MVLRQGTLLFVCLHHKNLLGGRVRQISSGSAPLSAKVTSFTKCVMGCHVSIVHRQRHNEISDILCPLHKVTL